MQSFVWFVVEHRAFKFQQGIWLRLTGKWFTLSNMCASCRLSSLHCLLNKGQNCISVLNYCQCCLWGPTASGFLQPGKQWCGTMLPRIGGSQTLLWVHPFGSTLIVVLWLLSRVCEENHSLGFVLNKDERFVSRYIATAIYCIIWKYRDIYYVIQCRFIEFLIQLFI